MKVKELIKELLECDGQDDVTVGLMCTPDGHYYVSKLSYIDTMEAPIILLSPHDFHSSTDSNHNPVPKKLEDTLCGIMVPPSDDGSYQEQCDDFVENVGVVMNSRKKKVKS